MNLFSDTISKVRGISAETRTTDDAQIQLPENARSYRIFNINGEKVETGNVEEGPGDEYMDLLEYFVEKYPDVREYFEKKFQAEKAAKQYMRVYLSMADFNDQVAGKKCTIDPEKATGGTILVTRKAGEAEILFPDGFRSWTALQDEDGNPVELTDSEKNAEFGKTYSQAMADKKEVATKVQEPQEPQDTN